MDFWIVLYLCPPDSSDACMLLTYTAKKRFRHVRQQHTSIV